MVGPDDAGAPGGAAVLPAGRQEAAEEAAEEEEDGERDGNRGLSRRSGGPGQERLLQRYLAALGPVAAAGGKRCPEKPANGAAYAVGPRGRMTNGDVGFLLLPPPEEPPPSSPPPRAGRAEPGRGEPGPEEAKLQNGGCLPCPPGPGGGGGPGGTALDEPLRSCRLRGEAERRGGAAAGSPSPLPLGPGDDAGSRAQAAPGVRTSRGRAEPAALPAAPLAFTDVNLNTRNTYEVSRRRSAPEHLPHGGTAAEAPAPPQEPAERARRAGIAGAGSSFAEFFTRNFFTKRTKELKPAVQSAPGWKLFGKVPPRENLPKDSKIIQQEYEARTGRMYKPPPPSARRKNIEFEPLSTTALILEDRPANLPAKSVEEALRHRQEYDEMVAEAKKREIKEAHKRKKIMRERFKQEENIASAMVIWVNEILPNWEGVRATRRVRELWWQGLPPSVRGKVWSLAVGNELNITPELYEIFLSRAKERWKSFSETSSENDAEDAGASVADREASLELIKLDISRTFPSLYIFQKGGPYHDLLHSVLGAYTCYRPDVGYVQGMSFIAAVLILNLEEADAFIAFANLLNKPCQLAFFRVDHSMMLKYFAAFEVFFEENLPKLFLHFKSYSLTPDIYLIDWIFTLYSKSLPLDLACRVWDVFCRDGEEFLFRTGLGILRLYEDILLQMDFIHIAQFLTKLPEDITSEKLFSCIAAIQMQNSNKKWAQVFASLMKDNKEGDKNHSPALKS
ncbi:TBC1 domain family member 12 isoform X2 [Falco rusticolus]|uniref:TBC1 domain family member 12 isoform X2 n=1 Tax=Falco rusticolus TaxID=120794 RepID=UPI00188655B7|nr:TBC1 domain family member 12 isoform X2 [Falco rusticolus]XP_055576670.1 TBC1 domain family member 12 isoform X2 [Falco cherrug]XP_055668659.1 TBC1 domain family member 12 isoform X2 [Falco peregrinus]